MTGESSARQALLTRALRERSPLDPDVLRTVGRIAAADADTELLGNLARRTDLPDDLAEALFLPDELDGLTRHLRARARTGTLEDARHRHGWATSLPYELTWPADTLAALAAQPDLDTDTAAWLADSGRFPVLFALASHPHWREDGWADACAAVAAALTAGTVAADDLADVEALLSRPDVLLATAHLPHYPLAALPKVRPDTPDLASVFADETFAACYLPRLAADLPLANARPTPSDVGDTEDPVAARIFELAAAVLAGTSGAEDAAIHVVTELVWDVTDPAHTALGAALGSPATGEALLTLLRTADGADLERALAAVRQVQTPLAGAYAAAVVANPNVTPEIARQVAVYDPELERAALQSLLAAGHDDQAVAWLADYDPRDVPAQAGPYGLTVRVLRAQLRDIDRWGTPRSSAALTAVAIEHGLLDEVPVPLLRRAVAGGKRFLPPSHPTRTVAASALTALTRRSDPTVTVALALIDTFDGTFGQLCDAAEALTDRPHSDAATQVTDAEAG